MLTKLLTLFCLMLAALVGAGAQTTPAPAPAPVAAAAPAGKSTASQSATGPHADSLASGSQRQATEPLADASTQRTGRHLFGMPLKWVIVGVAAVVSVIAIAAYLHNRPPPFRRALH
ncbi:MAG: hypothetical protein ACREDR_32005, partial [Blastocatellia bacterium]